MICQCVRRKIEKKTGFCQQSRLDVKISTPYSLLTSKFHFKTS